MVNIMEPKTATILANNCRKSFLFILLTFTHLYDIIIEYA